MKIGFLGNFGTGNLGNECTLQAILHGARRHVPQAELTCICSEPADTMRRHGIEATVISLKYGGSAAPPARSRAGLLRRAMRRLPLELRDWRRASAIARSLDMLVMTGTGMLTDADEGPLGLPYEILRWSLAARVRGTPLLFVSVGVESMRHPLTRRFIRTSLGLARYRSYRDGQSRDQLQRIGFAVARDAVCPDLAFSLPPSILAGTHDAPSRRPTVGVGLYCYRSSGGGGDVEAYRGYVDKICVFVNWLLENGYRVRIIIGDLHYDEAVRRDVRSSLTCRGIDLGDGRFVDEPPTSVEELIEQIAGTDLVVATRFHSVLLALLLGRPVVSISYNEKNDALMTEMGLARYCQPIEGFDVGRVIDQFRSLEQEGPRLRSAVSEKCTQYRNELEEQYARVFRAV